MGRDQVSVVGHARKLLELLLGSGEVLEVLGVDPEELDLAFVLQQGHFNNRLHYHQSLPEISKNYISSSAWNR